MDTQQRYAGWGLAIGAVMGAWAGFKLLGIPGAFFGTIIGGIVVGVLGAAMGGP